VPAGLTRSRFLRSAVGAAAAVALTPPRVVFAAITAPRLSGITVRNGGRPYEGDRPLFATVSPGIDGRDTAVVSFDLQRPARVQLDVIRTALRQRTVVWSTAEELPVGQQRLTWTPEWGAPVGTYVLRLTVEGGGGARRIYGGQRPAVPGASKAPVVRLLGIEASFGSRSYAPGDVATLTITADAERLMLQTLHCGAEPEYTDRADEMSGLPVGPLVTLPWRPYRNAPQKLRMRIGDWPSGVYTVRLTARDGREGFAPFVVRPKELGKSRTAVIVPTNTWQAYNFYDADGDGFGDTWYAGGNPPVVLNRPYRERGVPPRFHRYDAPFLRWLALTDKSPDFLTDDDLETIESGEIGRAHV